MKKRVVFQFTVFDESNKELAKEIAGEFKGVTKVAEVEGREGQLEVRGEFSPSELKEELKKIDKSVESIKIRADVVKKPKVKLQQQGKSKEPDIRKIQQQGKGKEPEVKIQQQDKAKEPEVKTQQQDESKLPSNIHNFPSDVASSSNSRGVPTYEPEVKIEQKDEGKRLTNIQQGGQERSDMGGGLAYEFLGQAIDVGVGAAKLAKDVGVGAAGKAIDVANLAKDMGVGAAGKAIDYYRKKNYEAQKQKKAREEEERRRKQAEVMKQKKIREEEERRKKQAEEMKQRKAREEEERRRKQAEEMKQKKAREEEERRRKQAEEKKQEKERRRKQAEEMERRKILLEKEKKKMWEIDLAIKKEEEKQKIWKEKQALEKTSGGTTWTGPTGSFLGALSSQLTGQTSTWMPLRTGETSAAGEASASTTQRRKEESKGVDKKGKNRQ